MIHIWTECDTKKALLSALVPAGVSAFTAYSVFKDKSVTEFFNASCECKWVPKDPAVYAALDILSFTPMGYAAYMVFKHGGGFDYNDTKVAMALYGGTLASWLAFIPTSKKKDRKLLLTHGVLHSALTIGTCYAFYQIDDVAGKLSVPVALLTTVYALMSYGGYKKFSSS
uniref:DUF998 domain-containing protein n=1 Tax=Strongyloides stercoralis TaxID=6248 RepID=A0A0K0DYX3_STRER